MPNNPQAGGRPTHTGVATGTCRLSLLGAASQPRCSYAISNLKAPAHMSLFVSKLCADIRLNSMKTCAGGLTVSTAGFFKLIVLTVPLLRSSHISSSSCSVPPYCAPTQNKLGAKQAPTQNKRAQRKTSCSCSSRPFKWSSVTCPATHPNKML